MTSLLRENGAEYRRGRQRYCSHDRRQNGSLIPLRPSSRLIEMSRAWKYFVEETRRLGRKALFDLRAGGVF